MRAGSAASLAGNGLQRAARAEPACAPASARRRSLQSFLPEEVTESYFKGKLDNKHLAEPVGTAELGEQRWTRRDRLDACLACRATAAAAASGR